MWRTLTPRSYVVETVGKDGRRWYQEHKIPLSLKGWQSTTSADDVALTDFILEERYRIVQVLEGSWDEGLIYRIALTLETESKYLQEKLEKFRRENEQRQSTSGSEANSGAATPADVAGTSKA